MSALPPDDPTRDDPTPDDPTRDDPTRDDPTPDDPTPDDLPCRELVELVTDHLEGALPERVEARLRAHLPGCEGCADHIAQVLATVALAAALPPPELPPGMVEALQEAYRRRAPQVL